MATPGVTPNRNGVPRASGRLKKEAGDTFASRLGTRIRAVRLARGLSMVDVVVRSGGKVSDASLSGYEKGVMPGLDKFLWLAAALDCSPMELLTDDAREAFTSKSGVDVAEVGAAMGRRDAGVARPG